MDALLLLAAVGDYRSKLGETILPALWAAFKGPLLFFVVVTLVRYFGASIVRAVGRYLFK